MKRFLVLSALGLTLAGCGGAPREPDSHLLRTRQGHTEAFAAATLIRAQPTGGEPIQMSLHLWRSAQGTVKAVATKAEVDVLIARLEPSGRLRVWSPRQNEVSDTTLTASDLPDLLRHLPVLMEELTHGPLPAEAAADDAGLLTARRADLTIQLALNGDQPTTKTVTTADGRQLLTIAYGDLKPFDTLLRPARLTLTTPDGEALVLLRRLEVLGEVSPERLRWDAPADAVAVPLPTLLDHLNR